MAHSGQSGYQPGKLTGALESPAVVKELSNNEENQGAKENIKNIQRVNPVVVVRWYANFRSR
jgi:hypothetical protein